MAREYNAKYNKATLFSFNNKDEEIKLKVKKDFEKFSHLFYLLKTAFKQSGYKFKNVYLQFESWKEEAKKIFQIETTIQMDNIPKYITHKICAIKLMDLMVSFVNTVSDFVCGDEDKTQDLSLRLQKLGNFECGNCNELFLIEDIYNICYQNMLAVWKFFFYLWMGL